MIDNPIFITGCYRSGTTYISRVLDSHPDFNITFDSVNYFRFIIKKNIPANDYQNIVKSISERMKKRYNIILGCKKIVNNIEKSNVITHQVIYSKIMESLFNYSKKIWGEKTLLEWSNIPIFLSMFPKGQVIHIIRDPRDVLASYKNMTYEKGDRYLDAIFASLGSLNASIHYSNALPSNRYKILIYEDFILNTTVACKDLCEFLTIEFTDEMLDGKNYKDIFGKKFDPKTHTSFPDEDRKPINRWKKKLSNDEIGLTEALVGSQMTHFGYELSTNINNNSLVWIVDILNNNSLIKDRFINFVESGEGIESYPSDSTDPKNWAVDTGIRGQGAAKAYGKN
jgi:hypothetical protein